MFDEQLNQERMAYGKASIEKLDIQVFELNSKCLTFQFKGCDVLYYPYSGWHTGKSIKDGRGLKNLLKQLK